jgi:hypothetical protein
MSDTNNIVEFPEAHLDAAKAEAQAFKATGPAGVTAKAAWRFDMDYVQNSQFDASEGLFLARQLEHIRAGLYEVQYTDLVYDRLMPINRSVPGTSREYTIRIMDKVGEAEILAEGSDAWPNVEATMSEKTMKFFMIGLGYSYSVDEARAAVALGMPLAATKAMVCKQQIERKVNDIALVGSTFGYGCAGLLTATDTGVLTNTAALGSGSGDTEFGGKSPDEVLTDLHAMTAKPWTESKGVFSVNTLLLPLTTRTNLASRRVGDGTNGSILSYFLSADQFIKSDDAVIGLWQLESSSAAGAGAAWTGKRAMAYRRDPGALELMINQPFEQFAPTVSGFYVKTLCRMKMGGLAIYQPATIIRMDEI